MIQTGSEVCEIYKVDYLWFMFYSYIIVYTIYTHEHNSHCTKKYDALGLVLDRKLPKKDSIIKFY